MTTDDPDLGTESMARTDRVIAGAVREEIWRLLRSAETGKVVRMIRMGEADGPDDDCRG